MDSDRRQLATSGWLAKSAIWTVGLMVAYVMSSGPVIGLGCWLRETLHDDRFYAVFWLYYPLFLVAEIFSPIGWYIEWWVVDVFHTVGPG